MRDQAQSKKLLLVDDEPTILTTLSVVLQGSGFDVQVAASVPEALEQIDRQKFDVLLSDLNIASESDGYTVVRAMRAANPLCVTIVITGYPGLESALQAIQHRVDDYILKPAPVDQLIATLEQKLAERRPRGRILSVSYDEVLLRTRQMLLEREGYEVVSTMGYADSLEQCRDGGFDLFVLGHSIPQQEKERMVEAFRRVCPAPIISLRRNAGDQFVDAADFHIEPDPEPLVKLIADVVSGSPPPPRQHS
jgi:DNA-binding NtrC family response regulator